MGIRGLARQWSLAGLSLASSPGDVRFLPSWLRSLRQSRSFGPLAHQVPYMPFSLTQELARFVNRNTEVFEYGSGGSTLWLAQRVGRLTSVEHHPAWHARVEEELRQAGLSNCTLALREPEESSVSVSQADVRYGSAVVAGSFEAYVRAIDSWPDNSLDLVLVDGRCRAACALKAAAKVRPGGLLVLDDSDRDRYACVRDPLKTWQRREFWGIKPFTPLPAHTTVWLKPLPDSRDSSDVSSQRG